MEKITIDNYEAFYLDFLEGNLNEEGQSMLELFLAEHPECRVDFDEIQIIPIKKEELLSNLDKQLLKHSDFNLLSVNHSTIETLLIAKTENLLNSNKIKEVDTFLASNRDLQKTEREFIATKLKADFKIVYEDKKQLKKERKIIPIWSVVASIAAIFILYFTLNFETNKDSIQLALKNPSSVSQINKQIQSDSIKNSILIEKAKHEKKSSVASDIQSDFDIVSNINRIHNTEVKSTNNELITLNLKNIKNIANSFDINDFEIEINEVKPSLPNSRISNPKVILYGMDEMKNPIQPITKQLSHLTKKEVDFKISKPKASGRKSFYLKIGKLEISRKRH